MVVLHTNFGDIVFELYPEKSPKSVANFLGYAKEGFYDGTIFHRVITGFMIQCGGITPDMKKKSATRPPIENEADNGLSNEMGTVSMARTDDPHSATAQFFINISNNDFLNHTGKNPKGWGYAVFGKVTQGMDVVDKIKAVPTAIKGFHKDVPVKNVQIESVEITEE